MSAPNHHLPPDLVPVVEDEPQDDEDQEEDHEDHDDGDGLVRAELLQVADREDDPAVVAVRPHVFPVEEQGAPSSHISKQVLKYEVFNR